jgi:hypothetical protein
VIRDGYFRVSGIAGGFGDKGDEGGWIVRLAGNGTRGHADGAES